MARIFNHVQSLIKNRILLKRYLSYFTNERGVSSVGSERMLDRHEVTSCEHPAIVIG